MSTTTLPAQEEQLKDRKQDIMRLLGILERSDTFHGHPFQARAYAKVIGQIKELPSVRTMKDVEEVKGVGKEIKLKIETILATGTLPSAEQAGSDPKFVAYDALLHVYGVGPVKARALIDAGIMTVDALREESTRNPKLLTAAQKLGLQYYEDTLERIPRAEMMVHEQLLHQAFTDAGLTMEVVGSYRRGLTSSGDIDCLVTGGTEMNQKGTREAFRGVMNSLIADGYIVGVLAKGDTKTLAYAKMGEKARRLDLLLTPPEEYPYAVLYFTGSDLFNIAMRSWALDRGYTMNEHGMTPVVSGGAGREAPPVMRSEQDIFAFLGLAYVPPTARVDGKQIRPVDETVAMSVPIPGQSMPTKKITLKFKTPKVPESEPESEPVSKTIVDLPLPPTIPKSIKLKLKLKPKND